MKKESTIYGVAVQQNSQWTYPTVPPFDSPEVYSEMSEECFPCGTEENQIYGAVRRCLQDCGLDVDRVGTAYWSPFSSMLSRGDTVVIKPNLVLDTADLKLQNTVVTHGSVIRPIVDYCWKAIGPTGKIIIGDAPQAEADFEKIVTQNGLKDTVQCLQNRGINVVLHDFRGIRVVIENGIWIGEQETNQYQSTGSCEVNLGKSSLLYRDDSIEPKYHGGGYDSTVTQQHHHGTIHEYKIAKEILTANAVISVPKLKTHKKAGLTCCLKNLVGINVDKNYLPHFTVGPSNQGGDEMPPVYGNRLLNVMLMRKIRDLVLDKHWRSAGKMIALCLRICCGVRDKEINLAKNASTKVSGSPVFQGAWPGNDTIWKMILDLNRVFLYGRADGTLSDEVQRKVLYLVDGIQIGVKNGPMEPETVAGGLIVAGFNALEIDTTILRMVGVDPNKIPLYQQALLQQAWLVPDGYHHTALNGKAWDGEKTLPITLIPPDNWTF